MKNIKKATFSVLSISALALALASCDDKRNTNTPSDAGFDLNQVYASVENGSNIYNVTYNEMYNAYRGNGYNSVVSEMKKKIAAKYMKEATYEAYTKQYNSLIFSAVYGTNAIKNFNDASSEELQKLKDKVDDFVRNEYSNYGIVITSSDAKFLKDYVNVLSKKDNINYQIDFTGHTDLKNILFEQYNYSVALTNLSREYNTRFADSEKIYSYDDNKDISNPNYIDEAQLKSSFQNTYYKYNQTKALIIRFNTYNEGLTFIEKTNSLVGEELNSTNAKTWYANLYNLKNADKKTIDTQNPFSEEFKDQTVFYNDLDSVNIGTKYSTTLESFINDDLKDANDTESTKPYYLQTLRNIDGNYYLVYRDSVNYYYGNGTGNDFDSVKSLTLADLKAKHGTSFDNYIFKDFADKPLKDTTTFAEYLKLKLIDSKSSESSGDTIITNKMKYNSNIEIYDPVFENQFINNYSGHYSLTKNFENNKVFKLTYTDDNFTPNDSSDDAAKVESSLSVADFISLSDKKSGAKTATTLLERKFVLNTELSNLLTNSESDSFRDSAKNTIKDFKKGNTSYSKKMGLENYLTLTYGITLNGDSEGALADYLKAQSLVSKYKTYYGYFVNNSDPKEPRFADTGLFANLKTYADRIEDKFYDINANHFLISIDPEKTGTHEDPRTYLASLDKVDPTLGLSNNFKKAVFELAKLISEESKLFADDSKDALSKLAKVYNNTGIPYTLNSKYAEELGYKSFDEFKNNYYMFNFVITAEDLSQITSSSVSSFVTEFKDYIEDVIVTSLDNDTKEAINKDGKLYEPSKYEDLCLTEYGYHVLNVYKQTEPSSAEFKSSDDSQTSSSSEKRYENQKIIISQKKADDTSDDLYVLASGYSDNKYVSVDQLFIYFFDNKNGSSTHLSSRVSSAVKSYFDSVSTKYTNASFQDYRLLQQMLGFDNLNNGTYSVVDGKTVYDENLTYSSIKFYLPDNKLDETKTLNYTKYIYNLTYSVSSGKEFTEDSVFKDWFEKDWTVDLTKTSYFHYDD